MRVLALTKYSARAASTRQRLLQFAPHLRQHGVEIEVRPLLDDRYMERLAVDEPHPRLEIAAAYARRLRDVAAAGAFDVLWVQYELFPFLPVIDGILARLVRIPIVYDIDDAIFHMYDSAGSAAVRHLLGGKLVPLMRRAAVCLCGNAYLASYVAQAGGHAEVVPTVVDTDAYVPRLRDDAPPVVGWIGSPSTWRYVEPVLPDILPVVRNHGALFRAVGAAPRAAIVPGVTAVAWSEEQEIAEVQAMDIGIMPLPDEPWARGKCGYKLIQYMACGAATVASPVGVNVDLVADGKEGFVAQTGAQWASALDRLLSDRGLRSAMGAAGREKVVRSYSLASQAPRVAAALKQAAESRHG
ncbi:glycosyltransferase [Erythrobacteraceae bacterium CFH 75059]|uniref:glycosyltransferase family 4 protein n=1 Tax=Qipengyuania thermophila TaxID=2509361 RepID=UPI0010228412|nr:glycosyltransferase family 4 protein [Qipengyuania thermophila]TCD04321.1 glycosyltransferase [Erythrobacteraceae bacterium CFH 75059]